MKIKAPTFADLFAETSPPSCGEVSANKSANVGALIFIVTLFGSVLIIAYHPSFVQRFLNTYIREITNHFSNFTQYVVSAHEESHPTFYSDA